MGQLPLEEANKILNEVIPPEEIEFIEKKQRNVELHPFHQPKHNDLASCINLMKSGFAVTKYNLKNGKSRRVLLRLSACRSKLVYTDMEEKKGLRKLLGPSVKTLKHYAGVIYGGKTHNFAKHRKIVKEEFEMEEMKENPNDANSIFTTMDPIQVATQ